MTRLNEPTGCGIYRVNIFGWRPFWRPKSKFANACKVHDERYTDRLNGHNSDATSYLVDREFLYKMLKASGRSWWWRTRAYLYYGIARLYGWVMW